MIVQYRSDKTKQTYTSEAECLAAEKEWDKAHAKELKAKEKRQSQIKEIEAAANDYLATLRENDKKKKALDDEASAKYTEYKRLLDKFADENKGYHLTYTNTGDNAIKIEECRQEQLTDAFAESRRLMRNWMNAFDFFDF